MTPDAQPVYSTLADDPDFEELVGQFVDELPERIDVLSSHLEQARWEELRSVAHQLKGAGGSYGFASITDLAARVECHVRAARPEAEIRQAVEALLHLCRRASRGAAR